GVGLARDGPCSLELRGHHPPEIAQMDVAGDELGERVHDRDDRLSEILIAHTGGAPEGARAGHIASVCRRAGTVFGHGKTDLAPESSETRPLCATACPQCRNTSERRKGGSDARFSSYRRHREDRKSTRLNSSHVKISYAVF